MNTGLITGSLLLGVGLAMDAFSVSVADGITEQNSEGGRGLLIAGTFAGFQFLMPMIGWICIHTLVFRFHSLDRVVHLIGAGLLFFLGAQMILEQVRGGREKESGQRGVCAGQEENGTPGTSGRKMLSGRMLLAQGIATSIDALSVGFAIADYTLPEAFVSSLLIGAVTLVLCLAGVRIGSGIGKRVTKYAGITGGVILIAIAVRILLMELL